MTARLASLLEAPCTDSLSQCARDIVVATRIDVICRKRGIDPMATLVQRLGSEARAKRIRHLVDVVGAVWPEAFALSPPCCRHLSHDEALLGTLIEAAEVGDRRWFDTVSRDLLNEEARDGLWREMLLFAGPEVSPRDR